MLLEYCMTTQKRGLSMISPLISYFSIFSPRVRHKSFLYCVPFFSLPWLFYFSILASRARHKPFLYSISFFRIFAIFIPRPLIFKRGHLRDNKSYNFSDWCIGFIFSLRVQQFNSQKISPKS